MQIFVISRHRMEQLMRSESFSAKDFNIISVVDPDAEFVFAIPTESNVLQLKFNDIEGDEGEEYIKSNSWVLFDESMAREIIEFLDGMDPEKNLIVHCTAGISRSGAIGDFIRSKFQLDFGDFMLTNPQIIPNSHVFRTLRDEQEIVNHWKEKREKEKIK